MLFISAVNSSLIVTVTRWVTYAVMVSSTSGDKAAETASKFLDVLRFFCFETVDGIARARLVLFGGILTLGDDMITENYKYTAFG